MTIVPSGLLQSVAAQTDDVLKLSAIPKNLLELGFCVHLILYTRNPNPNTLQSLKAYASQIHIKYLDHWAWSHLNRQLMEQLVDPEDLRVILDQAKDERRQLRSKHTITTYKPFDIVERKIILASCAPLGTNPLSIDDDCSFLYEERKNEEFILRAFVQYRSLYKTIKELIAK